MGKKGLRQRPLSETVFWPCAHCDKARYQHRDDRCPAPAKTSFAPANFRRRLKEGKP